MIFPINILIIDDNRDQLKIYIRLLINNFNGRLFHPEQYPDILDIKLNIDEADSFSVSRDKLLSNHYDIVVADLAIPGMSGSKYGGLEIIREARDIDPFQKIIVVTGYGSLDLAIASLQFGIFDFIQKSEDIGDKLPNSIERAISIIYEDALRKGNPFTPTTGMSPKVFGGRKSEVLFFDEKLQKLFDTSSSEHFLVLGEWGIGKTTLLREYKRLSQLRGFICTYVPLPPIEEKSSLFDATKTLIEGIIRGLPFSLDKMSKLTKYFSSIGFNILGTGFEITKDTTRTELSPQAFLYDSLLELFKDIQKDHTALIVLLDDFENYSKVPEFAMLLKQTLSMDAVRKERILFGIATTPSSWLSISSLNNNNPISRYFLPKIELLRLSQIEVNNTLKALLEGSGIIIADEVIDSINYYSQGHPFEFQLICYYLYQNQLSRMINIDVWDKALKSTLNDLGISVFNYWYNELSSFGIEIIILLTKNGSEMSMIQALNHLCINDKKMSEEVFNQNLQLLLQKGFIRKINIYDIAIVDRLFGHYLLIRQDQA